MSASKVNTIELPNFHIKLGRGFILFFALIYFFDNSGFISALFPAVLMHELGHIFVMLLFGARPTQLKATLSGFKIDYLGSLNDSKELIIALSGPFFGLLFAFLCAKLGRLWESDYLLMCAGLGFVLNFFNLLPAMPLDGGRILVFALRALFGEGKAQKLAAAVGKLTAAALLVSGLYFIARGFGFALFLAGSWLFILQQNKSCK